MINMILEKGHNLGNGGYTGSNITMMDHQEIYLEIEKGKKIIQKEFGIDVKIYQPENGYINNTIKESAYYADSIITTFNKSPKNDPEKLPEQIIAEMGNGLFNPGDIIAIHIDENKGINELIASIASAVKKAGLDFLTVDALLDTDYSETPVEEIAGWDEISINADFDPNAAVTGQFFEKIFTEDKVIFLAFYNWGNDETVTVLLDLLQRINIQAAFFLRGSDIAKNPSMAAKIDEAGHDVYSSSYNDTDIMTQSAEDLQNELIQSYHELIQAIGKQPKLYFFSPYLKRNKQIINTILAAGFDAIILPEYDQSVKYLTIEDFYNNLENFENNGEILCLPLPDEPAEINTLTEIINSLQEKGFRLKKLSEYLEPN
jgi:peptidoglycan/xylan/chitin deacetylase (PgdA/CDA1 family)